MPSCRLLPHGAYSLIPGVLTTMGWIASLFQDGCDYALLSGDVVHAIAQNPDAPWLEVGYSAYREPHNVDNAGNWEIIYSGKCLNYPPEHVQLDTFWKAAEGFAFLGQVLGGGGTFFLWFNSCCAFSRGTWRWAGYEILLASISQALSFLWYNTALCQDAGNDCTLSWGSKTDIVATVFWFVAALCIFCHYPVPDQVMGDGLMVNDELDMDNSDSNQELEEEEDNCDEDDPFTDMAKKRGQRDGLQNYSGLDSSTESMQSGEDSSQRSSKNGGIV